MAKGLTPTQRTLRELRARGLECAIVEKYVGVVSRKSSDGGESKRLGFRQDLFGIIDIIALGPSGVIGVQSCGDSFSQHWNKLTIDKYQETHNWLSTPGCTLELWAWRKIKAKRGGKAEIWAPRVVEITMADLMPEF